MYPSIGGTGVDDEVVGRAADLYGGNITTAAIVRRMPQELVTMASTYLTSALVTVPDIARGANSLSPRAKAARSW